MVLILPECRRCRAYPTIRLFSQRRWMRGSGPRMPDGVFIRGEARHTRRDEVADRRRRIAQLSQHLFRMLAEHGRMPVDLRSVVIEQDGIAGRAHLAEPRMLDLLHHTPRDDLRVV